jgi:hypothetical protein
LFVHGRPQDDRWARNHLESGPLAYFKKATKYLAANPDLVADIVAESG